VSDLVTGYDELIEDINLNEVLTAANSILFTLFVELS
jgi:hypothetical protein